MGKDQSKPKVKIDPLSGLDVDPACLAAQKQLKPTELSTQEISRRMAASRAADGRRHRRR